MNLFLSLNLIRAFEIASGRACDYFSELVEGFERVRRGRARRVAGDWLLSLRFLRFLAEFQELGCNLL